ncbi:hypothetical protein NMY22_g9830 [Coprinellus aureogranulatus]|nr:hypothetical protein NMY22_g9830 [Coprinellus aureogranulatus]
MTTAVAVCTIVTTFVVILRAQIYYYITTIDEELRAIWPQPRWKLGKILFLTTRYSGLVAMGSEIAYGNPHYVKFDVAGCSALFKVGQAVRLETLDAVLGYPCAFTSPDPRYLRLDGVASYLSLVFALGTTAVGLATLILRYRKQRNGLLRVITREGGIRLISLLVLKSFVAVVSTPQSKFEDTYRVLWTLAFIFSNIFSLRMLLLLKTIDDPGTRSVVSGIVFGITPEQEDDEFPDVESPTISDGMHEDAPGNQATLTVDRAGGTETPLGAVYVDETALVLSKPRYGLGPGDNDRDQENTLCSHRPQRVLLESLRPNFTAPSARNSQPDNRRELRTDVAAGKRPRINPDSTKLQETSEGEQLEGSPGGWSDEESLNATTVRATVTELKVHANDQSPTIFREQLRAVTYPLMAQHIHF